MALNALLLLLALTGCGVARSNQIAELQPQQLTQLSDREICQGLRFNKSNTNLRAEEARRGNLSDCSQDHLKCTGWGAVAGTPAYAQCRSSLALAEMQRRHAAQNAIAATQRQPEPAPALSPMPMAGPSMIITPTGAHPCFGPFAGATFCN